MSKSETIKPSRSKRFVFWFIYLLFVGFIIEFSLRTYYAVSLKNAAVLVSPIAAIERYYPGIWEEINANLDPDDGVYDVLMLGGSVLTTYGSGNIENELIKICRDSLNTKVKFHNLSSAAHTSRDSFNKYRLLQGKKYDAVFLYHGINSTRFNNCPEEMFKEDYSHVDFYEKVNTILNNPLSRYSILPLVYATIKTNLLRTYANEKYLPLHAASRSNHKDWIVYGLEVKTATSYVSNYDFIFKNACSNNQPVIVPSFVYYIPPDYTLQKFNAKELDYSTHINPIELWGSSATVSAGIQAHNLALLNLFEEYKDSCRVFYFDLNNSFEKNNSNFDDVCHLTQKGSLEFARKVFPLLKESIISQAKL